VSRSKSVEGLIQGNALTALALGQAFFDAFERLLSVALKDAEAGDYDVFCGAIAATSPSCAVREKMSDFGPWNRRKSLFLGSENRPGAM
jgi:hypothetical protein